MQNSKRYWHRRNEGGRWSYAPITEASARAMGFGSPNVLTDEENQARIRERAGAKGKPRKASVGSIHDPRLPTKEQRETQACLCEGCETPRKGERFCPLHMQRWVACGRPDFKVFAAFGGPTPKQWAKIRDEELTRA